MTKKDNRSARSLERSEENRKQKELRRKREIRLFFAAWLALILSPLLTNWPIAGIEDATSYLRYLCSFIILAYSLKMWQYARPSARPDRTDPLGS